MRHAFSSTINLSIHCIYISILLFCIHFHALSTDETATPYHFKISPIVNSLRIMGDLYFDNSADKIIDDWINDVQQGDAGDVGVAVDATVIDDGTTKLGIGYDASKDTNKTKKGVSLTERLTKANKRKNNVKMYETFEEHGIVEENLESRVGAVRSKTKSGTKPPSSERDNPKFQNDSSNCQGPETSKRKRVKTRSKQKNIRRDKRGLEFKPCHLQPGSKNYRGRPLTAETKQILGMSTSTKKRKISHEYGQDKVDEGS